MSERGGSDRVGSQREASVRDDGDLAEASDASFNRKSPSFGRASSRRSFHRENSRGIVTGYIRDNSPERKSMRGLAISSPERDTQASVLDQAYVTCVFPSHVCVSKYVCGPMGRVCVSLSLHVTPAVLVCITALRGCRLMSSVAV